MIVKVYKAIPTFYNGIEFRSRLEARWAIFFDNMTKNQKCITGRTNWIVQLVIFQNLFLCLSK